jgi:hypothetical protein
LYRHPRGPAIKRLPENPVRVACEAYHNVRFTAYLNLYRIFVSTVNCGGLWSSGK